MPFHHHHRLSRRFVLGVYGTVAGLGCLLALSAEAAGDCRAQAQTGHERVYCQIIAQEAESGLPGWEDFRRNEPRIQALLLKRPAARLGLELPGPDRAPPVRSRDQATAKPEDTFNEKPAPGTPRRSSAPAPAAATAVGAMLGGCRLEGEAIACAGRRFQLVGNQPNQALAAGALSAAQTLGLTPFRGNRENETAVRDYLSRSYDTYIDKMLEIGLAGATMSFTAFYHGFYRHEAEGVDYATRLESTYQFLKQDKQANPVKARFHNRLPQSMAACTGLSARIVVCDDVDTNWVYQRRP